MDKFGVARLVESNFLRQGQRRQCIRNYSIDSTAILSVVKISGVIGIRSHPLGVLDGVAIIIDEVESPVRSDVHIDGPEPSICRGNELDLLFEAPRAVSCAQI